MYKKTLTCMVLLWANNRNKNRQDSKFFDTPVIYFFSFWRDPLHPSGLTNS